MASVDRKNAREDLESDALRELKHIRLEQDVVFDELEKKRKTLRRILASNALMLLPPELVLTSKEVQGLIDVRSELIRASSQLQRLEAENASLTRELDRWCWQVQLITGKDLSSTFAIRDPHRRLQLMNSALNISASLLEGILRDDETTSMRGAHTNNSVSEQHGSLLEVLVCSICAQRLRGVGGNTTGAVGGGPGRKADVLSSGGSTTSPYRNRSAYSADIGLG